MIDEKDVVYGTRVKVLDGCSDWRSPDRDTFILGWPNDRSKYSKLIAVYKPGKYGGYPGVCDGISYNEKWNVDIDHLELIMPAYNKKIKPYPSQCSVCYYPAREAGKNKLCSNQKCKTHKNIKRAYSSLIKPSTMRRGVSKDGMLICLECKEALFLCVFITEKDRLYDDTKEVYSDYCVILNCSNYHYQKRSILIGDKIHPHGSLTPLEYTGIDKQGRHNWVGQSQ